MKSYYNTWEAARAGADRMAELECELEEYKAGLIWAEDYISRLRTAIAEKQREFDLLAELKMKHQ
jgi:hypothetical protein